ncbi:GntR family transcriptional regulator [Aureimonas sp. Leaf324]|uniref:GntR family transcriptional regulator n=1 Tax=Aureimonas sp. Leaf324 TaxID=1736336 RepID=UPI0006FDA8DF|nr:GntR family transcriptional regulator [Aureimonas sp. Leaf324]KQQ91319.1 hypothetical protein ASF65_02050 [Aureimonas sp. Leaf324]
MKPGETGARRPTYERIAEILRAALEADRVPPGTVLSEVPLARLFGAGRSPVRQALGRLEADGLVSRFDGRGFLVGHETPSRAEVTPAMLGLCAGTLDLVHARPADALYYGVERELILRSLRGAARVNELALSRHLRMGRTVAHDILVRAQASGILEKGENSRWVIRALGAERIEQFYELRLILEPVAIAQAAGRIPDAMLAEVEARHRDAANAWTASEAAVLDQLETDLHVTCLGFAANTEITEALRRSRTVLLSGKHVQRALGPAATVDRFVDEHLSVIECLRRGDGAAAAIEMRRHLVLARDKALDRLRAYQTMPEAAGQASYFEG